MCLTKSRADALSTMVAVGFILQNERMPLTKFGYEKPEDAHDHDVVAQALSYVNVPVVFEHLPPKGNMPCIFAKTKSVWTEKQLQGIVDELGAVVPALNTAARRGPPLYGAYIGAKVSVPAIHVVGPSDLELYKPKFRGIESVSSIMDSYKKAKTSTNMVLGILRSMRPAIINRLKITITAVDLIDYVSEEYTEARPLLFKSYHGMINTMMKYLSTARTDDVFLELALGDATTKVASCIPCSLFMTANGMNATATHFGRGDNWNIPDIPNNSWCRRKWEDQVKKNYDAAATHLTQRLGPYSKIKDVIGYVSSVGGRDTVPAIFLEALTFEGSFLDKIKATLT